MKRNFKFCVFIFGGNEWIKFIYVLSIILGIRDKNKILDWYCLL